MRIRLLLVFPCAAACLIASAFLCAQSAGENEQKALEAQKGHDQRVQDRGRRVFYHEKFDLSGLPAYRPATRVSGTVRIWGLNYLTDGKLARYWDEGFRAFHPEARVEYHTPTALVAVPGLITGLADIGASRKMTFDELLTYQRVFNRHPLELTVLTGSYNVPGWAPATGIYVHQGNPLGQLSLEQIDGIFGAERTGSYIQGVWHPETARGPEKNLRTWGQLGLGERGPTSPSTSTAVPCACTSSTSSRSGPSTAATNGPNRCTNPTATCWPISPRIPMGSPSAT